MSTARDFEHQTTADFFDDRGSPGRHTPRCLEESPDSSSKLTLGCQRAAPRVYTRRRQRQLDSETEIQTETAVVREVRVFRISSQFRSDVEVFCEIDFDCWPIWPLCRFIGSNFV
jgi:hypothetical protein